MTTYDICMKSLLEKLKAYDEKIIALERELKQLNDQYCNGNTVKQQITMYLLMRNNISYQNERKILESKISLLRAERDKCYTDEKISIQHRLDIF